MYMEALLGFLILLAYILIERAVSKLCYITLHKNSVPMEDNFEPVELGCQETKN